MDFVYAPERSTQQKDVDSTDEEGFESVDVDAMIRKGQLGKVQP